MDIDITITPETFSERDASAATEALRDSALRQLGDNRLILAARYRVSTHRLLGLVQRYEVEVSLRTVYPELIVASRGAASLPKAAHKATGKAVAKLLRSARRDAGLARTGLQSAVREISG